MRLNQEQGVTIILVTHERDIADYTQRVVTMRDGRIVTDERNRPRQGSATAELGQVQAGIELFDAGEHRPASVEDASGRGGSAWALAEMIMAAAAQALVRNKMRSALTMLGVFIGVAALIAMVAVGQGANEAVRKQIASLGTNLFVVVPGASTTGGVRSGFGSASTLTVTDADAIRREVSEVASGPGAIGSVSTKVVGAVVPKVADGRLGNIVSDLFKGARGSNPIGTGSTADAIRSEIETGIRTGGKFHSQKGVEYVRALDNWLQKNLSASNYDRLVAV